jgi:hypothetical protein
MILYPSDWLCIAGIVPETAMLSAFLTWAFVPM